MSTGSVQITGERDGRWSVSVNGGTRRTYKTLDEALTAAGNVTFAVGELPGSWRVTISEP